MKREGCKDARRAGLWVGLWASLWVLTWAGPTLGYELTTADRVAMLYSPQLQFSVDGDPLIKIGLVEGRTSITFRAEAEVIVLPMGDGGPEVRLPAGRDYEVRVLDGRPGTYRYWATVGQALPSERGRARELRELWAERGYVTQTFDLGSFFAIRGATFDNRQTLVGVGGTEDRAEALRVAQEIESRWDIPIDLHVELLDFPTGRLELTDTSTGVTIRHRDLLWVETSEETTFEVPGQVFGDAASADARRFVGSLIFTLDRAGTLALVNDLPTERLLRGIVPAETYASAPMPALEAQAVAARGELLADLGVRYLADPYMTCADVRCQVYRGVGLEHPRTSQAVDESRGLVLLYDGHLARTVYSATCGGSLGDYASTWGQEPIPYLTHHVDAYHVPVEFADGVGPEGVRAFLSADVDAFDAIESYGGDRLYRWTVEMTAEQVTEAVAQRYDVGRVTDLEVLERDTSGRAVVLRIRGEAGQVVVERELPIRRALGGLRSALFVMSVRRDTLGDLAAVTFQGGGYGHGVGLCQIGAIGASQRGLDVLAILSHYYPGTTPVHLWD